MNDTAHDELIESLAELRRALPSMRLGQLVANMATVAKGAVAGAVWEMEDDELLDAIRWQLQQLASRAAAVGGDPAAAPDRGGTAPSPGSTPTAPPGQVN
jgi:hypothetical protein